MAAIDEEDDDSIYSGGPLPSPRVQLKETFLEAEDCKQLDEFLDIEEDEYEEEEEATSNATTSDSATGSVVVLDDDDDVPPAPVIEELRESMGALDVVAEGFEDDTLGIPKKTMSTLDRDVEDEDDWFDSDEQKEVESLESSDDSLRRSSEVANGIARTVPNLSKISNTTAAAASRPEVRNEKKPNGGGLSLLSRASQTFYKAFRKGTKKTSTASTSAAHGATKRVDNSDVTGQQHAEQMDQIHARLDQLLEAQIATLNGAKTGFVDLRLMQPMTEKTLEAIERDAKALLGDFGSLEKRAKELEQDARKAQREADDELETKEQILITAKVRLAEASAEVDELRHELKSVQKELAKPERVERRKREQRKRTAERLRLEARAVGEAREEVEKRLGERRKSLGRERQEVERLESGYRDMEGDWGV